MAEPIIVDVSELQTDMEDEIGQFFTIVVFCADGSNRELRFSLAGGRALREVLDAVPELDGGKW